ncbi:hypothetical protein RN001_010663 [Aquatica leii]|uniref:Uncharacterized protein n=1 Tax=Aquatica leii TaxID=1421715 RepID=A0AAN7P6W4_9COLE|nr:hypothetical protein RN001_010663 [Aquatica leii]
MENENTISTESDMEKVIQQVYSKCDVGNDNSVLVSTLLRFMMIPDSLFELAELKKKLDPDDKDPSITCETFSKVVLECAQFHDLLKLDAAIEYHNQEEIENDHLERVKELEHKNKQLMNELEYIKTQLVGIEEQHDALLAEKKDMSQKLLKLDKLNHELKLSISRDCEFNVIVGEHEKEVHKLKKSLTNALKNNDILKEHIKKIESEKIKLQDKINLLTKRDDVNKHLIKELHFELQDKENKILAFSESDANLQTQLCEQQQNVMHYTESNKILKTQIATLESIISDHKLQFSILKTSFAPIINSPKPETPGRQILKRIFNFNSPKLLYSLANPVSPTINSPVPYSIDDCPEVDDSLSDWNDSDVFSNNNETYIKVSLSGDNSLCDELLLADQEFHKHECQRIIRTQKTKIEELEDSLKNRNKLNDEIQQLKARVTDTESNNEKLKAENERLLYTLSEDVKTKDVLHKEVVQLRECSNTKKMGNFSKMELKLEKRDAQIDLLLSKLNAQEKNMQKLNEQIRGLVTERDRETTERQLVEKQLETTLEKMKRIFNESSKLKLEVTELKYELARCKTDFIDFCNHFKYDISSLFHQSLKISSEKDLRGNFDVTSEFGRLVPEICEVIDCNTDLYMRIVDAFKNDLNTIDDRYKHQCVSYESHRERLWEEFTKLEFMLKSFKLCLSNDSIIDCIRQLQSLEETCQKNFEVLTSYGALDYEHRHLKYVNLLITYTTTIQKQLHLRYSIVNVWFW